MPTEPDPAAAAASASSIDASSPGEASATPTVLAATELAREAPLLSRATASLTAFTNCAAHLTRTAAVVFTSDRDGLPQLYVGDAAHPADPPRRLPTPDERIGRATLTADERAVLFTSDVGSDEAFHVFRIALDGSGLADLTPATGTMHRSSPFVARDRRDLFAYSAHDTASAKTSLFVEDMSGAPPREAYADEHGGDLIDLSPDGKRALFRRSSSPLDSVVFEIDLGTGASSPVSPSDEHAHGRPSMITARYSSSSDRIFVATQRSGYRAELIALGRGTGKPLARYEESILPHGFIRDILVSPTGDRIAIGVDGGTHDEIRILDARTLKLARTVETPLGMALLDDYARDGKHFTITLSHPGAPTDVHLVDTRTGIATPLRTEERPGAPATSPVKVSVESIFAFDGESIPTNVYLPDPIKPGARLPVLVRIHDGPASSAEIRWSSEVSFFTSLGYAVVEPNIRGSTGFGVDYAKADRRMMRADALHDVESVNYWVRLQPWCDTTRLVISGEGYGGQMALLALGRQAPIWRAGIDLSGASDLRTVAIAQDQAVRALGEAEFGVLGDQDRLLLSWSPIHYLGSIAAPVLVYQGARDPITPQSEGDQLVKALRARSVPVEYIVLPNEGHGITRRENLASFYARAARFLEEHAGPS